MGGHQRPSTAGSQRQVSAAYINSRIPGMNPSIRPYWQNVANNAGSNGVTISELTSQNRSPVSGDWEVVSDPMEGFYEAQASYLEQMTAMQEAQMAALQDSAQAGQVESSKSAADFAQTNAADTQRKQLLRKGLMSTFTRYPENRGAAQKAAKLGG